MRPYVIALGVMALLIGSLFQAAETTGIRLMRMFGTLGILLFGIVGTMAISRWQSRAGLQTVEAGLKSLEPECLITDWAHQGKGRPDFLIVAPAGLIAITLDEMPHTVKGARAADRIAKARQRATDSVRWLRDQMTCGFGDGTSVSEIPVSAFVVLLRRQAKPEDTSEGVTVLNPEELSSKLGGFKVPVTLDERLRIKLTRHFRHAANG